MKEVFRLLIDAKTKGSENIKRLGNSMQGLQGKVKNAGLAVQGLGKAFAALGVAMSAGAFAAGIKSAIDQADAMGKLSTRTGIAADKLQALVNAGKLADVSQEQLTAGLRLFARTQTQAAKGVATYTEAYGKLGLSVANQDGTLKASDQLLGELADKFAALPNGPEKAAVAMDLFGESGAQMITLLNGGSESLERFNYELSENFAQNAELFNDEITKMQIGFERMGMTLTDRLLPALLTTMDVFGQVFSTEDDWTKFFDLVINGFKGIAIAALATGRFMEETVRGYFAFFRAVDAMRRLDFGALQENSKQYQAGFADRFSKNIEQFQQLLDAAKQAPSDYGGGDNQSVFQMPSLTAGLGSSASERDRLEQQILQARERQLEAAAAALTADRKQIENLHQRLSGANLEQQILLETDAIKRIQLESDQRRNALYAEHARQMQGGVSIEQSLVAAQLLQVQLSTEKIQTQQQLAKAIANAKDESKSFDQSFRDGLEQMGNLAENLGNRLSSAVGEFSDAFTDFLITGKQSFQEFAASLLSDLSRVFMRFAMINALKAVIGSADGNVFQGGSIVPYAKGGIVSRPTLFPMANGMGLMGEAGPEAVMPLRRHANGRLGVEASGGAGNVVVNVDARGTQVEGDNARSRQLGDAIGVAVREELIAQKRPGGLLS
ncbi:MAG: hypothetical protein CMA49_00565 [Euryarchaeota archaeon]|nr:hypothetical protein [Euryarchaeota archaeon]|tara:strand:- start:27064 stop:29064 length:2001 start_codon:yes stop_codon:yes gene_type:complete